MSEETFVNSARRLYVKVNSAYVHIPTLVLEEVPVTREEVWFSSSDVIDGVPHENGTVVAQSMAYRVETKMFKSADATPQLLSGLKAIKACKHKVGSDVRQDCVIVEPDGDQWAVSCDVLNVITLRGKTEDTAGMHFELKRRGAAAAYTGALT